MITDEPEHLVRYTEEFVLELQQELVKARLREAGAADQLKETHERLLHVELENRDLRKENQLEEALFDAHQAKKLEAEAISALRELQVGLQANLSKDAVRTFTTGLGGNPDLIRLHFIIQKVNKNHFF